VDPNIVDASSNRPARRLWGAKCFALLIPFTAILHHGVFYPSTCLLNPFGADYVPAVVWGWLSRDPSLAWAALAAAGIHMTGVHARVGAFVRASVVPFTIAFVPLSIWIWDIPFASRPVCANWHDGRLIVPVLGTVRSKHLYALGAMLFSAILASRWVGARAAKATVRVDAKNPEVRRGGCG
jgi:hypothetical protein